MPIRITGLNSGLDTEAIISELVSAYRTKSEKYTKAQTKLSWKQTAWKDLNTKVNTLFSNVRTMKYTGAYNTKKATVSDATKASVTVKSSAALGNYDLKINQVAKAGYLTGAELGSDTTENTTLASLGYTGTDGTISVTAEGKTTDIAVSSTTTISDFVKSLNNAGVNASYDSSNHRIFVNAKKSGKANDFSISANNANGGVALSKLGLATDSSAEMDAYKLYAAYARNEDGNAYITFDSDGNAVTNGTYSAAKTDEYVKSVKTTLAEKSALITNNQAKIKYANAYQTVQDANKNLTADQQELFQTLGGKSDLTDVWAGSDNKVYEKQSDGTYKTALSDGTTASYTEDELTAQGVTLTAGADRLAELETTAGTTGAAYASAAAVLEQSADSRSDLDADAIEAAYSAGTLDTYTAEKTTEIAEAQTYISSNSFINGDTASAAAIIAKVAYAAGVLDGSETLPSSTGAVRIQGQDTEIELNGATYHSEGTDITVNGLSISALNPTNGNSISVSVTNDSQGMYDKIKSFIKGYNELMNEMTKLYNADSAKDYDPLTSEEKDAMTDTEVEEWEKKIKDSLLRRDDSLESLMTTMKNVMFGTYTVNGKNYSLSSFGISTLGVFNSADNEENAFHIDGDSDDSYVSGNTDKLLAALQQDPDTVADFMMQLANKLYDSIDEKMKSSTLSSYGVVYNDKEMAQEYSDYTDTISKWEDKLKDIEDSYYKKFAAMESALATLQSQQSSFSSLLG